MCLLPRATLHSDSEQEGTENTRPPPHPPKGEYQECLLGKNMKKGYKENGKICKKK